MTTITINEVEVETDSFNEEQNKIFEEVKALDVEIRKFMYIANVLKEKQDTLAPLLLPKQE
jgi:hypothetical protein